MKKLLIGLVSLLSLSSYANNSIRGEIALDCGFTVEDTYRILAGTLNVKPEVLLECGYTVQEVYELRSRLTEGASTQMMQESQPFSTVDLYLLLERAESARE